MQCNRRLTVTRRTAINDRRPAERHHRITNNNAMEVHVGKRLRLRRTLLGMSQEQLAAELNITFQQVQK